MQSSPPERVYVDTNIWFSYVTEGNFDQQFEKSCRVIDDIIRNNNRKAIVSTLVILEMVNIIRNKIAQRTQHLTYGDTWKTNYMKQEINKYTKAFMDKITKWDSTNKCSITDVSTPVKDLFSETSKIQQKTFGKIGESGTCNICKGPFQSYFYKGIDHHDIQHALIAKELQVTELVTFDKGYNYIVDDFRKHYKIRIL